MKVTVINDISKERLTIDGAFTEWDALVTASKRWGKFGKSHITSVQQDRELFFVRAHKNGVLITIRMRIEEVAE